MDFTCMYLWIHSLRRKERVASYILCAHRVLLEPTLKNYGDVQRLRRRDNGKAYCRAQCESVIYYLQRKKRSELNVDSVSRSHCCCRVWREPQMRRWKISYSRRRRVARIMIFIIIIAIINNLKELRRRIYHFGWISIDATPFIFRNKYQ